MKVLIVTPDLHGPIRNGGIGTAFALLAQSLSHAGHELSVLYTLGDYCEQGNIEDWIVFYQKRGIEVIALNKTLFTDEPILETTLYRSRSWMVHQWLRKNYCLYDLSIFPEWMGLAYYAILARDCGLGYENFRFYINTHSAEAWAMEGNYQLPEWPDEIERDFMERECVRRADRVISPSRYMFDWMLGHGWAVPANSVVVPNVPPEGPAEGALRQLAPVSRLVFFGRLERRKGLYLFFNALTRLNDGARARLHSVVLLGKPGAGITISELRQLADTYSESLGIRFELVMDRNKDDAMELLRSPDCLAVVPSLVENAPYTVAECLANGIRFVASNVGGIAEMLAEDCQTTHLFEPKPAVLADLLGQMLMHGCDRARAAHDRSAIIGAWLSAIDLAKTFNAARLGRDVEAIVDEARPRVSVCLVHFDRPALLRIALDSLYKQNYGNFEVILVDDGSRSADAVIYLDSIAEEFTARDWRIIRKSNGYLGEARNAAAEVARGDYLLFMDDDNVALPNMIETFVACALRTGADILTCVNMPFSGDGVPQLPAERIWIPLGNSVGVGLYRNAFGDANALWRRDLFERLGGFTTDYGVGHEDWELFAQASLAGAKLELIPEPLYWYRVNPSGMLRGGDGWIDHGRSIRPFLQHAPNGMGVALAYGLYLHRRRELELSTHHVSPWRMMTKALGIARAGENRARFFAIWRELGFKAALRRALMRLAR